MGGMIVSERAVGGSAGITHWRGRRWEDNNNHINFIISNKTPRGVMGAQIQSGS